MSIPAFSFASFKSTSEFAESRTALVAKQNTGIFSSSLYIKLEYSVSADTVLSMAALQSFPLEFTPSPVRTVRSCLYIGVTMPSLISAFKRRVELVPISIT